MASHASSRSISHVVVADSLPSGRHAGPPREVWPLLATIGVTELTMGGVILWFSAPSVAPMAITGLGLGLAGTVALALLLRLFGRLIAPRPTPHAGSRAM